MGIFIVHANKNLARHPISALQIEKAVAGYKKNDPIPPTRDCPFIVSGSTKRVYYVDFSDKTFGTSHGAIVDAKDSLQLIPDMVSSSEYDPARPGNVLNTKILP